MATFAVLNADKVVTNVIVAADLQTAELVSGNTCIEYTEKNPAAIGWYHDGNNFVDSSAIGMAPDEIKKLQQGN